MNFDLTLGGSGRAETSWSFDVIDSFLACVWVKPNVPKFAVFSYSTANELNALAWTVTSGGNVSILIDGTVT